MNSHLKNAIMLWTGGKDSSLALYMAISSGYQINRLVTFIPKNQKFLAHPIKFMKYQEDALNLQHNTMEINKPYKEEAEINTTPDESGPILEEVKFDSIETDKYQFESYSAIVDQRKDHVKLKK